jgi:hypothetical protein
VTKRQGGRRDKDGFPTSFTSASEREHQLEDRVLQLTRQVREERVRVLIDLRLASGLITEKERSEAEATMTKLSDEALGMIRQDLVKVLARINNATSIQDAAGRSTMAPYIH